VKGKKADKWIDGRNQNHSITWSKKYLQIFHAALLNALGCECHEYSLGSSASIVIAVIETEMALRKSRQA
jgi:hypothetical protein